MEYKRPAGAYPLHDFHKICRVSTAFQDALGVKILLDLLKGRRNYASDPQTFWRCKNALDVLYNHAKFGRARISPAAGVAKNVEFFVGLSVCLSVTLLNVRDCAPDFAMKALEYRKDFDAVGQAKVCRCALMLNFLRLMTIGDITKCRSPKNVKKRQKLVFSPPQDDRINPSRRNFADRRVPLGLL